MPVKENGDPRLQALFGAADPREAGVRPTVRLPAKGVPPVIVAFAAIVTAVLLFVVLDARRTRQPVPSAAQQPLENAGSAWAPPPPLYVPPVAHPMPYTAPVEKPASLPAAPAPQAARTPRLTAVPARQPTPLPAPILVPPSAVPALLPQQHVSTGSPIVIDTGGTGSPARPAAQSGNGRAGAPAGSDDAPKPIERVRASSFANRSMTVPQGYLIPAVLETAFDSTKPGYARAIVSREVRGFDGKNVLIPRGSRLVGQYKSTTAQGQNRAIISWTRLIRPDGMTIEMDAPAVDTVGRGGVAASVNTHFFSRLGDALLQTTVGLGQALAGRSTSAPVILLSGDTSASASQLTAARGEYTPTLKVPPGKSISIFVAQDLDFSAAAPAR